MNTREPKLARQRSYLVASLLAFAACTPEVAVAPAAPLAVASAPAPADPAPAPPAPPPDESQTARTARVRLVAAETVVAIGAKVALSVENIDDHAHRFQDMGANNGCHRIWSTQLVDARGTVYRDEDPSPNKVCATVMIPPRWITIEPGKPLAMTVDTGMTWYVAASDPVGKSRVVSRLAPGKYRVRVLGAGLELEAPIEIVAKRR